jgi:hypothetical protein
MDVSSFTVTFSDFLTELFYSFLCEVIQVYIWICKKKEGGKCKPGTMKNLKWYIFDHLFILISLLVVPGIA